LGNVAVQYATGAGYQPGTSLGCGLTFGYLAGEEIMKQAARPPAGADARAVAP
jgi:hypothetical protein